MKKLSDFARTSKSDVVMYRRFQSLVLLDRVKVSSVRSIPCWEAVKEGGPRGGVGSSSSNQVSGITAEIATEAKSSG